MVLDSKRALLSHYNTNAQHIIRRMILEDWKQSEAKLPTYMKLLSMFIISEDVPDEWLKKLSHQTMSKMLKKTSTPRYEFWACLHLYLGKKYGNIGLGNKKASDVEILGKSMGAFGSTPDVKINGFYRLTPTEVIYLLDQDDYLQIAIVNYQQTDKPFSDVVYTNYEGACIQKGADLIGLIRQVGTKNTELLDLNPNEFNELDHSELKRRLTEVSGIS